MIMNSFGRHLAKTVHDHEPPPPGGAVSRLLDGDDHLAGRAGRALGLKGFWQGAQLEDSRDHRPQLLAVDERGQLAKLAAVGLDDKEHTADVAAPRRGRAGFLGDGDQDAAAAQQRPGACGGTAADRVDDDVNVVDVVLEPAGVVEDVVGPQPGDEGLVPGRCRGGHPGPVPRRELNGVGADAARAAVHQDVLPGLELRVLMQGLPCGERAQRDGRGSDVIDGGGLGCEVGGGGRDESGGRAGAVEPDQAVDLVAGLPAGNVRACRGDYAGQVVAGDGRPLLRPGELVGGDGGGADLDEQFAGPGIGHGYASRRSGWQDRHSQRAWRASGPDRSRLVSVSVLAGPREGRRGGLSGRVSRGSVRMGARRDPGTRPGRRRAGFRR